MTNILQRIKGYEQVYAEDYGFEREMVKSRQKYIKELILEKEPKRVLEIGCGLEQFFPLVSDCNFIERWTIIEPSDEFFYIAKKCIHDDRVKLVKGFIEQVVEKEEMDQVDLCLCSSLLHEVESPSVILDAAKSVTKSTGLIHINVPNAGSMHRLLAVEMGLIDSIYDASARNKALAQFHVFDHSSLMELVINTGLKVEDSGGYFIKPFSHAQMEKIIDAIGEDVLLGLYHLGRKMPEIASEIYINASVGS